MPTSPRMVAHGRRATLPRGLRYLKLVWAPKKLVRRLSRRTDRDKVPTPVVGDITGPAHEYRASRPGVCEAGAKSESRRHTRRNALGVNKRSGRAGPMGRVTKILHVQADASASLAILDLVSGEAVRRIAAHICRAPSPPCRGAPAATGQGQRGGADQDRVEEGLQAGGEHRHRGYDRRPQPSGRPAGRTRTARLAEAAATTGRTRPRAVGLDKAPISQAPSGRPRPGRPGPTGGERRGGGRRGRALGVGLDRCPG